MQINGKLILILNEEITKVLVDAGTPLTSAEPAALRITRMLDRHPTIKVALVGVRGKRAAKPLVVHNG